MSRPTHVTDAPACAPMLAPLASLDRHYAGLLEEFVGRIQAGGPLDDRLRELCAVTTTTALDESDELELHLRRAQTVGLPAAQALEAVLLAFVFSGLPRMRRGVAVFERVYGHGAVCGQDPADYPEEPTIDGYNGAALRVGIEMYGPARARINAARWRARDEQLAVAVEKTIYAGVDSRRVLEPAVREICATAALAARGFTSDLEWHAKAALRLGATDGQLRWATINQLPHAGFPPILQALRSLDAVLADWWAHPATDAEN